MNNRNDQNGLISTVAAEGGTFTALIHSSRASSATRSALLARDKPDDPAYRPATLTPAGLGVLRALVARVLPGCGIDLAARMDAALETGDGWRFDALPTDGAAYRAALSTLDAAAQAGHGQPFVDLFARDQDALLADAAFGRLNARPLDAAQMRLWFEDARAAAVRHYMAHPATLARIGYSGAFYGGDGPGKPGFVQVGPGQREPWEPLPGCAA